MRNQTRWNHFDLKFIWIFYCKKSPSLLLWRVLTSERSKYQLCKFSNNSNFLLLLICLTDVFAFLFVMTLCIFGSLMKTDVSHVMVLKHQIKCVVTLVRMSEKRTEKRAGLYLKLIISNRYWKQNIDVWRIPYGCAT